MSTDDTVAEVLAHSLQGSGIIVDSVQITPAGKRRVVKVIVDRELDATGDITEPTQPLTLDEIADATRTVSDALDEGDLLGELPYTLEVSSPGIGRDLSTPAHYRRNVGRLLRVEPNDGEPVIGRLLRASETDLDIETLAEKKVPARRHTWAYADLRRGEVQVEFTRPSATSEESEKEN